MEIKYNKHANLFQINLLIWKNIMLSLSFNLQQNKLKMNNKIIRKSGAEKHKRNKRKQKEKDWSYYYLRNLKFLDINVKSKSKT
jgi:hypothetical protein